ncbi:MAG: PQQ-binding-like beta-propeller repeat protein [Firmicutes bacterium]|nr:PQQ-binding-like beta-propeller repeat protein [Bacillota bacterium]
MRINDTNSIQNPYLTQGKPAQQQTPSVFGSDQVQTGQTKPQFGLSQNQINSIFEKGPQTLPSASANWEVKFGNFAGSQKTCLLASDGNFYASQNNKLCKFDGKTGDVIWSKKTTSSVGSAGDFPLEGKDGTIISNSIDKKLRGYDPATGNEKWSIDLGTAFEAPAKVLSNGDIMVARKIDDQLCLTRLDQDGKEKNTIKLGFWDEPIGTSSLDKTKLLSEEPDGSVLVHGTIREGKKTGTEYVPSHMLTFCITPDDKVKWTISGFDPPVSFNGNPDRLFRVDYDQLQSFDKTSGQQVWNQQRNYFQDRNCGDKYFTIAGEQKHKYVKFIDSRDGKLILQSYAEGPLRKTKSGEEIICVDQNDLNKVIWKKDSAGSIFAGPLYTDKDVIIHIADEDKGIVEALDPATGNTKWTAAINEQSFIPDEKKDGKKERTKINQAIKTDDGSIFVMTNHGVFGIDEQKCGVKSAAISPGQLSQFRVDTKSQTIIAVDQENHVIRQYPTTSIAEQRKEAFNKEQEEAAAQQPAPPSIQETEKEVIIGGISLKKNSNS